MHWTSWALSVLLMGLSGIGVLPQEVDTKAGEAPLGAEAPMTPSCGGWFKDRNHGIIQTPGFPGPFPTPATCTWVVDASHLAAPNIICRLTQLYVISGLTLTGYAYYGDEDIKMGEKELLSISEQNALTSSIVHTRSPYLVVRLHLPRLEGNHLRALPHLLGAFGFNITWEAHEFAESSASPSSLVPSKSCSVLACSLAGDCLASADYKSYNCHCYSGHSGENCSIGPECQGDSNPCRNGATCRQIGGFLEAHCICRAGYSGKYCDTRILDHEKDCPGGATCSDCRTGASGAPPTGERARFSTTVTLAGNSSAGGARRHSVVEQALRSLRNKSSTKIEDFRLLSTGSGVGKLTFQWLSLESAREALRQAVSALLQTGRWGELAISPHHYTFTAEPVLRLLSLTASSSTAGPASNEAPDTTPPTEHPDAGSPTTPATHSQGLQVLVVREGEDLVLTCHAEGSSNVSFVWLKDGLSVNDTRATKWMWTRSQSEEPWRHESELGVRAALPIQGGRYTCRARDWGSWACRSIRVVVRPAPEVRVTPMTSTLRRGENQTMTCLAGEVSEKERLGFTWTKNRALLPLSPGREVWEDLHPAGSILRIYDAQRTAEYCCHVRGRSLSRSACSQMHVVTTPGSDPGSGSETELGSQSGIVPVCPAAESHDVLWPDTAAGADACVPCPSQYVGRAACRTCSLLAVGRPEWDQPDFSNCKPRQLVTVKEQLEAVEMGLSNSSAGAVLSSALSWGRTGSALRLPGEGYALLSLLRQAAIYLSSLPQPTLQLTTSVLSPGTSQDDAVQDGGSHEGVAPHDVASDSAAPSPKASTAAPSEIDQIRTFTLEGIDLLLRKPRALNSEQHVVELQRLARSLSMLWSQGLPPGTNKHLALPTITLDVTTIDLSKQAEDINVQIPPASSRLSSWREGRVNVRFRHERRSKESNRTLVLSVISFSNITKLLPQRFITQFKDDTELEVELHSRVISLWLRNSSGDNFVHLPPGFLAEVWLPTAEENVMSPVMKSEDGLDWELTCGLTEAIGLTGAGVWDLEACSMHPDPRANMTSCSCQRTGTMALLYIAKSSRAVPISNAGPPVAVLVGCCCCLVLSTFSLVALVVVAARCRAYWSCILVLKMQCCCATMAAMTILIHVTVRTPPEAAFATITSGLQALMLIGLSSHVTKLLVVYTELLRMRNLSEINKAVVGCTTGAPVLAVLCSHLAQVSARWPVRSWWVQLGSASFNMFVTSAVLLLLLFILVYCSVSRRLTAKELDEKEQSRRRGLIRRAALLLCVTAIMQTSSIVYVNHTQETTCYIFGSTAGALGLVIVLCYVIFPDSVLYSESSWSSHADLFKEPQKDSASLTFFTRQDADAESECAVPLDLLQAGHGAQVVWKRDPCLVDPPVPVKQGTPAVVRCSVDVEPGRVLEVTPVIDVPASYTTTTFVLKSPSHRDLDPNVIDETSKQAVPDITLTKTDNVLHRISQDLDYLLNRTPQESTDTKVVTTRRNSRCAPPSPGVIGSILEEEEEIEDEETKTSAM